MNSSIPLAQNMPNQLRSMARSERGTSTFTAGPAEVHKPRRARLDPFFSRRNVLKMEYLVDSRIEALQRIMSSKFSRNEAVDLHHAFRAISVDVISDYAFGESYELLARDDLGREFWDLTTGIGPTWWVFQQWPAMQSLAMSLPTSVAKAMNKPLKQVLTLLEVLSLSTPLCSILTCLAFPDPSPRRQGQTRRG
jgi:cytochrome P450